MMKKRYVIPQAEVVKLEVNRILSGSYTGNNLPDGLKTTPGRDTSDDDTRSRYFDFDD